MIMELVPVRITEKRPFFSVLPKSVKRAKNLFFAIETTPKWLLAVNNSAKGYFFLLTKLPSHG